MYHTPEGSPPGGLSGPGAWVLHIKFGSNTFHKSAATDKGVNGQANPAAKLMAETSSVNGWIVGAIASAVAGVALLALGSKQTTTSVPV